MLNYAIFSGLLIIVLPGFEGETCLILHDAVKPLTTLLVSEIKMAAQRYHNQRFQMSCKAFFSVKSP